MKFLRFFAAGAAFLALASCGKDYNSSPTGTTPGNNVNPLLPLGTASEGQIRYRRWTDKIRINGASWAELTLDKDTTRVVTGAVFSNGQSEALSLTLPHYKSSVSTYNTIDSVGVLLSFVTDPNDPASATMYSNTERDGARGRATLTLSEQNATTLKGTFSARLTRQFPTTDTNDVIEISEGSFWVKRKQQ